MGLKASDLVLVLVHIPFFSFFFPALIQIPYQLSIIFPPAAVAVVCGLDVDLIINLLLTL